MYKVIFHVVEKNKWRMVTNNAMNLAKSDLEIEVLVLSVGESILGYAKDSDVVENLEMLMANGIKLIACNNSLKAFELPEENILDGIEVVPAGMVEMVKRQADGYMYIRP